MLDKSVPTSPTFNILPLSPDIPLITSVTYSGPNVLDAAGATVNTTAYVLPSVGTAFASRLADFSALTSFSITAVAPTEPGFV